MITVAGYWNLWRNLVASLWHELGVQHVAPWAATEVAVRRKRTPALTLSVAICCTVQQHGRGRGHALTCDRPASAAVVLRTSQRPGEAAPWARLSSKRRTRRVWVRLANVTQHARTTHNLPNAYMRVHACAPQWRAHTPEPLESGESASASASS